MTSRHRSDRFTMAVVCLLALAVARVGATAQTPDRIRIDEKECALLSNPLEEYLRQNPHRRPQREVISTANRRGYVAHFAIVDGDLMVTDVRIETGGERRDRSALSQVFPQARPVVAEWFTGHLVIPDGAMTRYVHLGYASLYERYIVIRVEAGKVTQVDRLPQASFVQFRDAQFEAFKRTDAYRTAVADALEGVPPWSPQEAEVFVFQYLSGEYTTRLFD